MLALGCVEQAVQRVRELPAVQVFKPNLGVLLFVVCRFLKECADLLVAFLFCDGPIKGIFVSCLGFA